MQGPTILPPVWKRWPCFNMSINELNPKVLLLLLGAIGLITLPHFGHIPLPLPVLFFALLLWRFSAIWQPRLLPGGLPVLLVTVIAVGLLISTHKGAWGREAGSAVFVVALGVKLLELNKKRDVYLVCFLALIIAGTQFLFQQSIGMLVYCLLISAGILGVLVALNSFKPQTRQAVRTAAKIMLQALPLAAVIFVLFPRFQPPKWALINHNNQAKSGLSETLDPGSISELLVSPKLVFRVKFNGDIPPKEQLYWRGPVFSFTDGQAWRMLHHEFVLDYQDKLKFFGKAFQYTELLEPQSQDWVYALDMPAQYDGGLQRDANYQLLSRDKQGEAAEYALLSYPQYNTGYITKTEYRDNLQIPDAPAPRIVDLVTQLHGFDEKPVVFIDRLFTHLRQQHFRYTLSPPLMENNFVERFLFDVRSGFCNHYATAFVYLMRVAGIPARVVSGYRGGELNPVGRFLEIRQANAHIWTEVWLRGQGWVRIDPTAAILSEGVRQNADVQKQIEPGAIIPQSSAAQEEPDQSKLKLAEQIWDDLDYHWQSWIVGYGGKSQEQSLSMMGIDNLLETLFWVLAAIGLAMLILAAYLLRTGQKPEDEAVLQYRQFCGKMAEAGVCIRLGEGANDFAVRAKAHRPEIGDAINEITGIFMRLRYQRVFSSQDLKLLKNRIKSL